MNTLHTRLDSLLMRIRAAEQRFLRTPGSVRLLAVGKKRSIDEILAVAAAGQLRFGESYLQEALKKLDAPGAGALEWHFIGPVQSNKTRFIAARFTWVHSVDRERIAVRLNDARPPELPPLNICLQVNISGEASKSGIDPDRLPGLAEEVSRLPRLALRGLMAMPELTDDFALQRAAFRRLQEAYQQLRSAGLPLDTLSMGTSTDLEAAIAEGATLVRIGTDLFGARPGSSFHASAD